jgi:hypothetical protein
MSAADKIFAFLEKTSKTVAALLALIAVLAFLVPCIETGVRLLTAWRFGAVGAVYYEVTKDREPTCGTKGADPAKCGHLFLLRGGPGYFENLKSGDVLQAASEINFRQLEPLDEGKWFAREKVPAPKDRVYSKHSRIFLLKEGECAIVFRRLRKLEDLTDPAHSGGWLKVGTTACGLFK